MKSAKELKNWIRVSHPLTKNKDHSARVLYHGSLSSFDGFDHTRGENSMFGRGMYLTSSAEDAGRYASKDVSVNPDIPAKAEWLQKELEISYREAREVVTSGNEQIYPLFVQIENPIVIGSGEPIKIRNKDVLINSLKFAGVKEPERAVRRFLSLVDYGKNKDNDAFLLSQDSGIRRAMEQYGDPSIVQLDIIGGMAMRELMISVRADGIILNNINKLYGWMEEGSAHYFVRLPEQIKSVFEFESNSEKTKPAIDVNQGGWHEDSHLLTKDVGGSPKVFYHGSNAVFETFDQNKIGSNTNRADSGVGFYFAHNRDGMLDSCASWYGEHITEHHLAILNPFVVPDKQTEMIEKVGEIFPDLRTRDGLSISDFAEAISAFKSIFDKKDVSVSDGIFDLKTYHFRDITVRNVHADESVYEKLLLQFIYNQTGASLPLLRDISPVAFTNALKDAGFDGVISPDEVVVFDADQIRKSTCEVTQNLGDGLFEKNEDKPSLSQIKV
jgi:hypothetical protein